MGSRSAQAYVALLLVGHGGRGRPAGRWLAAGRPRCDCDDAPVAAAPWSAGTSASGDLLPTIYVVTPTHARLTQKADLTRLANTLRLAPRLHWIVVEDAADKSPLVARLLFRSGIPHTHLHASSETQGAAGEPRYKHHRGVKQRNAALGYLRGQLAGAAAGVVYFADDDNAYDVRLFEGMRSTTLLRVWNVGLVGGLRYEGPVVDDTGAFVRWRTAWRPERPLPVDMAGFAVGLEALLKRPEAAFSPSSERGYLESDFAKFFLRTPADMEFLPGRATEVLVWHTRTEASDTQRERAIGDGSDLEV